MLRALARRKTGAWSATELLQELTAYEDPLTASVFARLEYLPTGIAWEVVRLAARPWVGEALPASPPSADGSWSLWPTLRHDDDHHKEREIPDVLWTLRHSDESARTLLIFEAKHGDVQQVWQWRNQLDATKDLAARRWLIAVGGDAVVGADDAARDTLLKVGGVGGVLLVGWRELGAAALRLARGSGLAPHERRILADLATAVRLWGYVDFRPLSDLPAYARGVSTRPARLPRLEHPAEREPLHPLLSHPIDPHALAAWSFR